VRLLVFEYFSHLDARHVDADLRRAGGAMRRAAEGDFRGLRGVRLAAEPGRAAGDPAGAARALRRGLHDADAALVIAPENHRILERLAAACERSGVRPLGPGPEAVRLAADKRRTGRLLAAAGVPSPDGLPIDASPPLVVKPRRGCGAVGATVVCRRRDLGAALRRAHAASGRDGIQVERFVPGVPLSAAFLVRAGARAARPGDVLCLGVAAQRLRLASDGIAYRGGTAPWDGSRDLETIARRAVAALMAAAPDVRGYLGVDLVLGTEGPVVIEINPRLTSSYLGWRRVHGAALGGLMVAAAEGRALPHRLEPRGRVAFDARGRVRRILPIGAVA
jgi:predicted ATP-grasp superfamily ATP-dependent carboligase